MNTKKKKNLKKELIVLKKYVLPKIEWIKKEATTKTYDLIPNTLGWSMKFIGKTGSGKTEFVSAFIEFLLNDIKNIDNVYLLSPTHDQNGWDRIRKSITHITDINEIVDCKNSVIVCDDMQTQLKGNKILTEMILNKRHRRLSIIQCKQYTH